MLRLLIAVLFVVAGIFVGALNAQPILIDLGYAALPATLGVALLACVLLGAVLAGLVLSTSVILPLRQALRRARARAPAQSPDNVQGP